MVLGELTTEYALDIYRKEDGYLVKEYKLHLTENKPQGVFHLKGEKQLSDSSLVVEYISNYPLGPSSFINQIVIYTKNPEQEKGLMDELLKLRTHRRMNIRNFIVDTN